jgi:ABC-2 type transport system permease protein
VPIDVFSGRVVGVAAVGAVALQCFWVAVACLAGRLLTTAGRRKLVVQGG